METAHPAITTQLLQDALLLKREIAIEKVSLILDGRLQELCLRTRYPKEMNSFIAACLAKRGELESGVGERCLFVRDSDTWSKLCNESSGCVLIAQPELDFESSRSELLQMARYSRNSVIFTMTNPRMDFPEIVDLIEPSRHDVLELLRKHGLPPADAERFAKRSNGNIHLLTQLLSGTSERRSWATGKDGYEIRCLALLGGWNDGNECDRKAVSLIIGQPYESWVQRLYPLTCEGEPPVLLEGKAFRPVSRYETWQQLGQYLTDTDLERFRISAIEILGENDPSLELPKEERAAAIFREKEPKMSPALIKGVAETLALLGGQGKNLNCSATLAAQTAESVVYSLLSKAQWQTWASLSGVMTFLAEAAPSAFLEAVDTSLRSSAESQLRFVFEANDDMLFGKNYHCGLLWALEILAWKPEYLNRVSVCLVRMTPFDLPANMGNNPLATLKSIFLPWLPQTLASVDDRRIAVERIIQENAELGWSLLMALLPESHQIGSYNQKPVWRDWIDSSWTEGVTRTEMNRQIQNYAELAVKCAMSDFKKLTDLIARWDHLPREVFQKVLEFLSSEKVVLRPESERFVLWQTLSDQVQRHRKYSAADWSMPEDDVKLLEVAADAILPKKASIVHQRLFNSYDHDFYETDNYREEEQRLAERREKAVKEVMAVEGFSEILKMAKAVKNPAELGSALGRAADAEIDAYVLPEYLESSERSFVDFARGYVWARYFKSSSDWMVSLNTAFWSLGQKIAYFSMLPFQAAVWRQASHELGDSVEEYWNRIWPNVFQAKDDLLEAVDCALEYGRPDLAIAGVNALRHLNHDVRNESCFKALRQLAGSTKEVVRINQHELVETIKYLQGQPEVDGDEMVWIEFQFLRLLDRFSGGAPVFLERRLATDSKFFHDTIIICYRSEHEKEKPKEIDSKAQETAGHVFRLLHDWRNPPGVEENGSVNEILLVDWVDEVKRLCLESGHWPIAQQTIGHTFAFHPAGLEGMLQNPVLARVLDTPEFDDMRIGFRMALFNERGVHGFSNGKEEAEIASKYHEYAGKYDSLKFTHLAVTLRSLAESYERDSERESKRDPYRVD